MIVRGWQDGDTDRLLLQASQEYMRKWLCNLNIEALGDLVWVAEDDDGDVVFIGGLFPQWENRAAVWSLVSAYAGPHMKGIHREVMRKLKMFNDQYRRLELTVDVGFTQGHRWAKMMGFSPEGLLNAYHPDGKDVIMYSRVRDDRS